MNPLGLPRNACNRTTLSAGRTTNTELWNDFKRHVPSTEYVVEVRNAIYRANFQKSINLNRVTPLVGQLSTKEYFFLHRGAAQDGGLKLPLPLCPALATLPKKRRMCPRRTEQLPQNDRLKDLTSHLPFSQRSSIVYLPRRALCPSPLGVRRLGVGRLGVRGLSRRRGLSVRGGVS